MSAGAQINWDDDVKSAPQIKWDEEPAATKPATTPAAATKPAEPSTWEKLTRGVNPSLDEFSAKHPVAGPIVRGLDAAGGALIGTIPSIASSIAHPVDTANAVGQSIEDWTTHPKEMVKGIPSILPELIGQNVGGAAAIGGTGELSSRIPDVIPEGAKSWVASKMREPATARQSFLGRPGNVKNILPPSMQRWSVPPSLVPKGEIGTPTNPGWFSEIKERMPSMGTDAAKAEAASRGGETIRVIPEPRAPFEGEKPGYMASVPRKSLRPLASSGKPGAGTQLQQLGERVIYTPPTGYPEPRLIQHIEEPSEETVRKPFRR